MPLQIAIAMRAHDGARADRAKADESLKVTDDEVERGIDEAKAALDAARADLALAEIEYDRFADLYKQDAVPKRKYQEVTRTRDAAAAHVKLAEAKLAKAVGDRGKVAVTRKTLDVWASNEFAAVAVAAVVLPVLVVIRVWGGSTPDEHLKRITKVRGYLLAMCTRTLLLLNLLAVLTLIAVYMVNLRDYPRAVAGAVLAGAALPMAATTLLTTVFHRRAWRPVWLFVGAIGSSACTWWLSSVDNFTSKGDLALMLAVWGGFVGLLPPVFLTDEVEVLDPRDFIYAGGLAIVCLVVPLVLVPMATQTTVSEWTDRAFDAQRQNLREERPAVRDATAMVADDYRQRGSTPAEAQGHAGVALAASVKLEATAHGIRSGLRFLSLMTGGFGLLIGSIRLLAPGQPIKTITR